MADVGLQEGDQDLACPDGCVVVLVPGEEDSGRPVGVIQALVTLEVEHSGVGTIIMRLALHVKCYPSASASRRYASPTQHHATSASKQIYISHV